MGGHAVAGFPAWPVAGFPTRAIAGSLRSMRLMDGATSRPPSTSNRISMVAQNVHFISAAWANIGVPVSVTCDPDFEESAVRDALKLVSTHDGCPVPHTFHGSSQAAFLNAAWKGGFASSIWSG